MMFKIFSIFNGELPEFTQFRNLLMTIMLHLHTADLSADYQGSGAYSNISQE